MASSSKVRSDGGGAAYSSSFKLRLIVAAVSVVEPKESLWTALLMGMARCGRPSTSDTPRHQLGGTRHTEGS